MPLKDDLEELFPSAKTPSPVNSSITEIVKNIPLTKVTDCIDALNTVHEVIISKKNQNLQELAKQIERSVNLLNVLRLVIDDVATTSPTETTSTDQIFGDEDPFELPIKQPKSGKITPTK